MENSNSAITQSTPTNTPALTPEGAKAKRAQALRPVLFFSIPTFILLLVWLGLNMGGLSVLVAPATPVAVMFVYLFIVRILQENRVNKGESLAPTQNASPLHIFIVLGVSTLVLLSLSLIQILSGQKSAEAGMMAGLFSLPIGSVVSLVVFILSIISLVRRTRSFITPLIGLASAIGFTICLVLALNA